MYWNAFCKLHQEFVTWGWIWMILLIADGEIGRGKPYAEKLEIIFSGFNNRKPLTSVISHFIMDSVVLLHGEKKGKLLHWING